MRLILAATASLIGASASAQDLVYWSVWSEAEPQAVVLQQLFDQYAADHPGVTISPVWIGRQNLVQMRSHMAGGGAVDVVDGDARQYLGLAVQENLFADLSDLAQELEGQTLPHTVELLNVEGVQHGLPYIHNAVVFLYSKEAFAEAGVEPPATLDELIAACQTLQDADYDPIALEGNLDFMNFYYATYLLNQITGPDYIRTLVEDKTGEAWRSPEVRQMLDQARQFWDSGCIPAVSSAYQWPAAQQNLAVGVAAMELVGSWVPTELANAVPEGFEWGAFPFPTVEGGANSNYLNTAMMAIGVHRDSQHADIAKDVVRFLMSEEAQQKMATEAAVGVIHANAEWIPALAEVKTIVEQAPGATVEDNVSAYYPDFGSTIMVPAFQRFFIGEIDADEFVDEMATATKDYWANR